MHFYIILTEAFCLQNAGYKRDNLVFSYAVTLGGAHVTSVNSLNEFPELFDGVAIDVLPLAKSAFPEPSFKTAPQSIEV